MLQHVVAIHWNDAVPDGYADTVVQALHEMVRSIDTVRDYRCGPDLGVSGADNADFVIVATFDDVAGWRVYDEHPLHNEVRATYFKPYIAKRSAAQFNF
jgi:hypothetical protein